APAARAAAYRRRPGPLGGSAGCGRRRAPARTCCLLCPRALSPAWTSTPCTPSLRNTARADRRAPHDRGSVPCAPAPGRCVGHEFVGARCTRKTRLLPLVTRNGQPPPKGPTKDVIA